jgi:hypothetical protein
VQQQAPPDAGADERAAALIAAVRSLARTQRRFRTATAFALATRDRAAFVQLDHERAEEMPRSQAARGLIDRLLKHGDSDWSDANLVGLVQALDSFPVWHFSGYEEVPLAALAKLITRNLEDRPPSPELAAAITALAQKRVDEGCRAEARRAAKSLADAVSRWTEPVTAPADLIDPEDDWGAAVHAALPADPGWIPFLEHARTATASKPAKRWLATAGERRETLGIAEFTALTNTLVQALDAPPSNEMRTGSGIGSFVGLNHLPRAVPTEDNANLLRGLIWTCSLQPDQDTADRVAEVARACSKRLPDIGARCPKVVNACLWTLSQMGEVGAPHLVALSQKTRKPAARKRVEAAIDRAAETAGTPRAVLEDMAVPTHGLESGPLTVTSAGVSCEVIIEPPGHVNLTWRDADGQTLAKPPTKAKTPKEVRAMRATLIAQRSRLERLMVNGTTWPWARYRDGVLGHPVVGSIASHLIVEGDDGDAFLPAAQTELPPLADDAAVHLWHPVGKTIKQIVGWRRQLERQQLVQPFKQAHREVYLLTPAEREAGARTERFAGHVVRQHALNGLCGARGWRYRLQGPFDPGPDSLPTIELPEHGLTAQLEVETIEDEGLQSAHAIFLYVQTGALRFFREEPRGSGPRGRRWPIRTPVALTEVPALALSEVLRDVDLFVSVAGVAADPTWPLNVSDEWAQTWREQAFGDLSPLGERRRELLEPVVKALPSADRFKLEDRFLHVKGQRHEYRIHLGSGNVLCEPGSRYVCIVAGGGGGLPGEPGHVWLPFEGDATLSLIVSKAMLLARDDQITDPAIRAQLDAP